MREYRNCPKCQGESTFREGILKCTACGKEFPVHESPKLPSGEALKLEAEIIQADNEAQYGKGNEKNNTKLQ